MKRFSSIIASILLLSPGIVASLSAQAQIKLPTILRDSMVLQRNAPIDIWGWASNGEKITIRFNNKTYHTITNPDGKWALQLSPQKAGGPYSMSVSGKNTITLNNILIGEVWVCAGQSNMEHQMKLHDVAYAREIADAHYPEIRQFKIPNTTSLEGPKDDLPAPQAGQPASCWKEANPIDVRDFSAVAFFFAKALYEKYHVPIGIINASWGGIPIEAMMSKESLATFPSLNKPSENHPALKPSEKPTDKTSRPSDTRTTAPQPDDIGLTEKWFDTAYQPKGWHTIAIPGYWEDQGARNLHGIVWYRKEIDIPASIANKPTKIFLGRIVDADEVYINGTKVGSTTYLYPQRRYPIPASLLHPGKNLIVIRVTNYSGKGGFVPDKPYEIHTTDTLTNNTAPQTAATLTNNTATNQPAHGDTILTATIPLTGYWQYKPGYIAPADKPFRAPSGNNLQNQPTALYNSMIAPITAYTIKGFVWYQGESNTGRAEEYAKLQPAMINDWRSKWKEGNLPFLFVQLPGFMEYNYLPSESNWALFREAQSQSLSLPNTGMAVAIDLGEWNDVHPDHKKEVGDRLALAAQTIAYPNIAIPNHLNHPSAQAPQLSSGPIFQSARIEGNKVTLTFTNTGSGLTTSDGQSPHEFAIAGEDKKFFWAKASIEGNQIIVSSDAIPSPRYVRYAWADDPINPNLYNKEGLPAAPFRTDH